MTRQDLADRLEAYLQAERVILAGGQGYQIKDRSLQRASLKDIQAGILSTRAELELLDAAGQRRRRRSVSITPRG